MEVRVEQNNSNSRRVEIKTKVFGADGDSVSEIFFDNVVSFDIANVGSVPVLFWFDNDPKTTLRPDAVRSFTCPAGDILNPAMFKIEFTQNKVYYDVDGLPIHYDNYTDRDIEYSQEEGYEGVPTGFYKYRPSDKCLELMYLIVVE